MSAAQDIVAERLRRETHMDTEEAKSTVSALTTDGYPVEVLLKASTTDLLRWCELGVMLREAAARGWDAS